MQLYLTEKQIHDKKRDHLLQRQHKFQNPACSHTIVIKKMCTRVTFIVTFSLVFFIPLASYVGQQEVSASITSLFSIKIQKQNKKERVHVLTLSKCFQFCELKVYESNFSLYPNRKVTKRLSWFLSILQKKTYMSYTLRVEGLIDTFPSSFFFAKLERREDTERHTAFKILQTFSCLFLFEFHTLCMCEKVSKFFQGD